jgi:hypothetical protein
MRTVLDVEEGLINMIFGQPLQIDQKQVDLYEAYKKKVNKNENKFEVERVVSEFEVIKEVLINNAITVDLDEIEGESQ